MMFLELLLLFLEIKIRHLKIQTYYSTQISLTQILMALIALKNRLNTSNRQIQIYENEKKSFKNIKYKYVMILNEACPALLVKLLS